MRDLMPRLTRRTHARLKCSWPRDVASFGPSVTTKLRAVRLHCWYLTLFCCAVPLDPGGASYDRVRNTPDPQLDCQFWTLAEREQYPYYFNRREARKKELLEHWAKIEKDWDEELDNIQKELPKEKPAISS